MVADVGVAACTVRTVVDHLTLQRDCSVCLHNKIIIGGNIYPKEMG